MSCSVTSCRKRARNGVRIFRFPRDLIRRAKWAENMGQTSFVPTDASCLCEQHFEESQYEQNRADGWRKLKPNALPTLFDTKPKPDVQSEESEVPIVEDSPINEEEFNNLCVEGTLITVGTFNTICRLCLETENLCPIQCTYVNDVKVADILERCIMCDIKNELLPQNICEKCLHNLCRIHEFQKRCQDNETILKNLIDASETEDQSEGGVLQSDITLVEEKITVKEDFESNDILADDKPSVDENVERYKLEKQKTCASVYSVKCRECDYTAPCMKDLYKHRKENHKYRKCEICGKVCRRRHIHQHMRTHTKPYQCDVCSEGFSLQMLLDSHKLKHTGERPHMCSYCARGFMREDHLLRHEKVVHSKERRLTEIEKILLCKVCGKGFSTSYSLEWHSYFHTGIKPRVRQSLKERNFLCSVCGKCFLSKTALEMHLRVHTGEKPFNCSKCKKAFAFISNLKIHMTTRHEELRPHKCDVCYKAFKLKFLLKEHMRIHTGEQPHQCKYCDAKFTWRGSWVAHVRKVHTGETPFKCHLCEKRYYRGGHLSKHMKTHEKAPRRKKT